jgi:hypothetical protein
MAIVEVRSTVSARYYEKRHRRVAEQNIRDMARSLNRPTPEGLNTLSKSDLVRLALDYHNLFPA